MLAAYAIVALFPAPRLLRWPGCYDQPAFFSQGLYRKLLHKGERIVVFPYGVTGPSMLWQAQTGMYFSMSGGYTGLVPEEFARWPVVTAALTGLPLAEPERQLRTFLEAHRVDAIVAAEGADLLPAQNFPKRLAFPPQFHLRAGKRNAISAQLESPRRLVDLGGGQLRNVTLQVAV